MHNNTSHLLGTLSFTVLAYHMASYDLCIPLHTHKRSHTALWDAHVVPTLSTFGSLGMHQLISSLSVWPNDQSLMKVSLVALLM